MRQRCSWHGRHQNDGPRDKMLLISTAYGDSNLVTTAAMSQHAVGLKHLRYLRVFWLKGVSCSLHGFGGLGC